MAHGWAYSHFGLCTGHPQPASDHTVSERGPAVNERPHHYPELGEFKGSVGSCPRVLHVSFSCVPWVLLSTEHWS